MTAIPDYIEQRIRRPIPADSCVVPGSTPVVAFGNARTATVATLGLNPSRVEFLDRYGRELVGVDRRLATHRSLGLSDLSDAPSSVVEQVLRDCIEYFSRNPYWQWFGHLEQVLNDIGASYSDGSACHLDLVQWATDPTWSGLPRGLQGKLTDDDAVFFKQQLTNENINLLLVNGKSVIDQLRRKREVILKEVNGVQNHNTRFVVGKVFDRVCVVGWSTNLQSSFGVTTEWKTAIADRAAQLVSDLGCNI